MGAEGPEDVGVGCGDVDVGEVAVDDGFVVAEDMLVGAVGDGHDVDVVEFFGGLAPVAVGEDVEAGDFGAGFLFEALGDGPLVEGVVGCDLFAGGEFLLVFEEGGESGDDVFLVELLGDFVEGLGINFFFFEAWEPDVFLDFVGRKFFF